MWYFVRTAPLGATGGCAGEWAHLGNSPEQSPDCRAASGVEAVSEPPGKKGGGDIPKRIKGKPFLLQGVTGKVICPDTGVGLESKLEGRGRFLKKDIIVRVWGPHHIHVMGTSLHGLGIFLQQQLSWDGTGWGCVYQSRAGDLQCGPWGAARQSRTSVMKEMLFIFLNFI